MKRRLWWWWIATSHHSLNHFVIGDMRQPPLCSLAPVSIHLSLSFFHSHSLATFCMLSFLFLFFNLYHITRSIRKCGQQAKRSLWILTVVINFLLSMLVFAIVICFGDSFVVCSSYFMLDCCWTTVIHGVMQQIDVARFKCMTQQYPSLKNICHAICQHLISI